MAVEWFYTTNKQQMGPVTWPELRELAEVGILKPHDMVWSEGMAEWVKAINQQDLFAEDEQGTASVTKKASYKAPKPPPGRRTGRKEDEEDEDDEEDTKEAKKKARKKQEGRAKMAVGLKVALTIGGVGGVLLLLGCGCGGLAWMAWPRAAPTGAPPYTITNLLERKHVDKRVDFRQNQRVIITASNNIPNMNVAILVFRGNDLNNPIRRVQQVDRTGRADFVAPANDSYVVRVANFGPGVANTINVTIDAT